MNGIYIYIYIYVSFIYTRLIYPRSINKIEGHFLYPVHPIHASIYPIPSHPIPSVNKIFSKFQKGPFQLRILKVLTPLLEHNRLERMSNEPFRVCFRRLPSGGKTIAVRTCHQPWTVTSRGPVFAAFFLKIRTKSTKTRGDPVHTANFSSKFYIG